MMNLRMQLIDQVTVRTFTVKTKIIQTPDCFFLLVCAGHLCR